MQDYCHIPGEERTEYKKLLTSVTKGLLAPWRHTNYGVARSLSVGRGPLISLHRLPTTQPKDWVFPFPFSFRSSNVYNHFEAK